VRRHSSVGLAATFESPTTTPLVYKLAVSTPLNAFSGSNRQPQSWLILLVVPLSAFGRVRGKSKWTDEASKYRKSASRASRSPSARAPPLSTATARSPRPPSSMATSRALRTTLPVRTRSSPQQQTKHKRTPAHHPRTLQKEAVSTR
jgi:hypothetical protein